MEDCRGRAVRANGFEMFRKLKKSGVGNGKKAVKTVKNGGKTRKNTRRLHTRGTAGRAAACEGVWGVGSGTAFCGRGSGNSSAGTGCEG